MSDNFPDPNHRSENVLFVRRSLLVISGGDFAASGPFHLFDQPGDSACAILLNVSEKRVTAGLKKISTLDLSDMLTT